jgi:hypothetical protein
MLKQCLMAFLISVAFFSCRPTPPQNPELDTYLQTIREWKMTEDAHGTIQMVAMIRCGYYNLTFTKDSASGTYGKSYASLVCPNPNADPGEVRKQQARVDSTIAVEIEKLRALADANGSGFVTTEEAQHFRTLIEFGLLADHIAKSEAPHGLRLARMLQVAVDLLDERIEEYKELVTKGKQQGVDLPPWPSELSPLLAK